MPEPTSSIGAAAVTAAGVTIFGIATGLHAETLLPGVLGGLWALSYSEPAPMWRRCTGLAFATLGAGYFTPTIATGLTSFAWWPARASAFMVQFPVAFVVGLLSYNLVAPALLKLFRAKVEREANR